MGSSHGGDSEGLFTFGSYEVIRDIGTDMSDRRKSVRGTTEQATRALPNVYSVVARI